MTAQGRTVQHSPCSRAQSVQQSTVPAAQSLQHSPCCKPLVTSTLSSAERLRQLTCPPLRPLVTSTLTCPATCPVTCLWPVLPCDHIMALSDCGRGSPAGAEHEHLTSSTCRCSSQVLLVSAMEIADGRVTGLSQMVV
jgi:hypothetical protein